MTTTQANPAIGQSIDANGIRTNYLSAGSGEQTVVLVHGSGPGVTAYANWRLVLPVLGENFTCYAPDMVGFGYSDRPEGVEYGLQTWADQTVGFIKAMGIEKCHLIGNSFGGSIALRIATHELGFFHLRHGIDREVIDELFSRRRFQDWVTVGTPGGMPDLAGVGS